MIIAGNGQAIYKQTNPMLQSPHVEVLSGIDDILLASYYNKAEVVVSLSAYEGFGIPVLEGLYFGCKVLCSSIDVYHELFESKVYFCNQNDVTDISCKLEEIVRQKPNSNAGFNNKYSYESAAEIILNTIAKSNTPYQ